MLSNITVMTMRLSRAGSMALNSTSIKVIEGILHRMGDLTMFTNYTARTYRFLIEADAQIPIPRWPWLFIIILTRLYSVVPSFIVLAWSLLPLSGEWCMERSLRMTQISMLSYVMEGHIWVEVFANVWNCDSTCNVCVIMTRALEGLGDVFMFLVVLSIPLPEVGISVSFQFSFNFFILSLEDTNFFNSK